jgi:hypothetical protein
MESDQLLGETTILKLTVSPMRNSTETVEVIGQRYASSMQQIKDKHIQDYYSLCKSYLCKYQVGGKKFQTVPFSNEFIIPLLDQLRTAHIPLLPTLRPPGKDGGYYKLEIGFQRTTPRVEFFWWSRSPEEWEPLVKLAKQLHIEAKHLPRKGIST